MQHINNIQQSLTKWLALSLFVSSLFLASFSVLLAHGYGVSFEEVIDGTLIDIGYSEEDITVGDSVNFDFNIYDENTGDAVSFSSIWVRIERENEVLYAGGIARPSIGATTMVYQFQLPGTYTLSTRFQDEDESIVESDFEFDVAEDTDADTTSSFFLYFVVGIFGVIAGVSGCFVLKLFRRKSEV